MHQDIETKIYESVVTTAQNAVNVGFLLNGSAAVGILTFMGTSAGNGLHAALARSLIAFAVGVALAAVAALLLYTAQLSYYKLTQDGSKPFWISGTALRVAFLVFAALSVVCFCSGIVITSNSVA